MPTTAKMGIVYPSSTDLVKDGATAMGTIATTVDNKSGLVLINRTSFSAVASQSLNNVFSANYDNYKIVVDAIGSTTNSISFRFRASGTDTTSNYTRQYIYGDNTSLSSARLTSQAQMGAIDMSSTVRGAVSYDIFNPFLARPTLMFGVNISRYASSSYAAVNGYGQDSTTSFDGITLTADTGTMTGAVSIYGYNQ